MGNLRFWSAILTFLIPLTWGASMRLPSYPLAVKTPYLSVWMPGHLSHDFPSATPQFWRGQSLTWIVMARIEDTTYCLMGCTGGRPGTVPAVQKSLNFTSTHTYVTLQAGSTEITMDFFSPVDPVDHVRQSLPFSYLAISQRTEGKHQPDVGLITAFDASWLSTRGQPYSNISISKGRPVLTMDGKQGREFSEFQQMALWGKVVLAARADSEYEQTSCQTGDPDTVLGSFIQTGSLDGVAGTMQHGSVAACTHRISPKYPSGGVFAVGLHQDHEMQYFDGNKIEYYVGYYRSKVDTLHEAVHYFLDDYPDALAQSHAFDRRIVEIGKVTSSNYSDLLEFTIRQSFAGQQVMISKDTLDTDHPYAFIKEISTDGNVNTLADLIPKALPVFHVLNPNYTRMFLEPVLRFSRNAWPLNHAVHDIGKSYPNATGETPCIEEFLPLDSTAVLLWMLYLYQDSTGDKDFAESYAPILRTYADYCNRYGLYPVLQRSSVDALGSATNQSALSVSAAIALNAYGKMTGHANYSKLGVSMAEQIVELGTDGLKTHFLTHYTDGDEAWVLMYPLAFDAWLRLDTFPKWVYKMQSDWYSKHTYPFGVQYRNNIRYTLMEWLMWVGAVSPDALRDHLINAVHRFLDQETGPRESVPGPTQWRVLPGSDEGVWTYFSKAKSVIGSIFMIAAVQGGFNETLVPARQAQSVKPLNPSAGGIGLLSQDQDLEITGTVTAAIEPDLVASHGVPFHVPVGASKAVTPSFLGLSFDTASFPLYAGNLTAAVPMSIDLIRNLVKISGAAITLRIGGPESDYAIYDPLQIFPIERVNVSGKSILSLGRSYFDSIRALDTIRNADWIYQVPFASHNIINAVQGTKEAMEAVPLQRLSALELGYKTNLYAAGARPKDYNCQAYAAELFEFKIALRDGVERIFTQFQALGLSHEYIDESWTMEECFTVGIKAQDDLRSVSTHYSHFSSSKELNSSKLPRHAAIVHEHKSFLPQVRYVRDIFSCHPFVISEASLVSTSAYDQEGDLSELHTHDPMGLAMWNLDFLLYSMSQNVSKVLMHQSCNSASSAWTPARCHIHESNKGRSGEVHSPYSALTFVASFVNGANNFRVIALEEGENSVVYAGYESGKLSKIAVVNYPPRHEAESASEPTSNLFQLRVPSEVVSLETTALISSTNLGESSEVSTPSSWNGRGNEQTPMGNDQSESLFMLHDGMLSVDLREGGAVLFEVR